MAIIASVYGGAFEGTVWPDLMAALDGEVDAYSDTTDAAYWYGEAQLTAMLGAQARRVTEDGWFLVEPSTQGRNRRVRFVDLWMGFGDRDDEQCTIEAKYLFALAGGEWLDRARRRLSSARRQLNALPRSNLVGAPISLLWVCVFARADQLDPVRAVFDQAVAELGEDPNVFVVACGYARAPLDDAGRIHHGFLAIGRLEADLWA